MLEKTGESTRKKAWILIAALALILLLIFVPRLAAGSRAPDVSTREERAAFLSGLGWEVDEESEEYRSVLIPDCSEGVMADYNLLQLSQGYDLSRYSGKECAQYSYTVTNYPNYERTVLVTLYVYGGQVIAGDIHTAALNGFMHELRENTSQ